MSSAKRKTFLMHTRMLLWKRQLCSTSASSKRSSISRSGTSRKQVRSISLRRGWRVTRIGISQKRINCQKNSRNKSSRWLRSGSANLYRISGKGKAELLLSSQAFRITLLWWWWASLWLYPGLRIRWLRQSAMTISKYRRGLVASNWLSGTSKMFPISHGLAALTWLMWQLVKSNLSLRFSNQRSPLKLFTILECLPTLRAKSTPTNFHWWTR